ncbi:hypothetical protein OIU91_40725 [Streptomyces sp. NBC_01456]|uniref:hypothetical protein n=1 Tax=unclassified Streptomyces TaxID=2593676 RepID=UPI002E31D4E7|nr:MULTISPECIES: hypothetical protein [unclassified Streptomyces]
MSPAVPSGLRDHPIARWTCSETGTGELFGMVMSEVWVSDMWVSEEWVSEEWVAQRP